MLGRSRDEVEYSAIDENQEEDEEDNEKDEEVERSSYYGGAAVPFIWETRPGTPKHNLFSTSSLLLPRPLTPPPSFFSSSSSSSTPKKHRKVKTKLTKFLSMSMFHSPKKSNNNTMTHNVSKPLYSWSSSSSSASYISSNSSSSFSSSPPQPLRKSVNRDQRCFLSCSKRSVSYSKDKEEDVHGSLLSSPTMTMCYSSGGRKGFTCSIFSLLGNKTKP